MNSLSNNLANLNKVAKKLPSPSEFLRQAVGRKVTIKLHNNYEYKGVLICLDGTMNVYLQQCEEWFNNEIKNRYAEIFIRGNNDRSQPYAKDYRRWNLWYDFNNPKHHEIKRLRTTFIEHIGRRLFKHEAYLRFFGAFCFVPFLFFLNKQRNKYKQPKEAEPSIYSTAQLVANTGRNAYGFETRANRTFEQAISVVVGGDLLGHILSADSDQFRSEEQQDEDAGLVGDFTEEDVLDLYREKKHEPHLGIVYRHPNRHHLNEAPNDLLSPYKVVGEKVHQKEHSHGHH